MSRNIKFYVMTVGLSSINAVKEFVDKASESSLDIALISDKWVVDAKSIMGVFSLDLSRPLEVYVLCDDASVYDEIQTEVNKLKEAFSKYDIQEESK